MDEDNRMTRAKQLIDKYRNGRCSPEELDVLYRWFDQLENPEQLTLSEQELEEARLEFQANLNLESPKIKPYAYFVKWAAAIFVLGLLSWFISQQFFPVSLLDTASVNFSETDTSDLRVTTLRLADGTSLNLSDLEDNQSITSVDGLDIYKDQEGFLHYHVSGEQAPSATNKNQVLITPIGEQAQITLGDGTRIWLNAKSKLTFPYRFSETGAREIELEGEAYFEVAHTTDAVSKKRQKFTVVSKMQRVHVLGTSFNINAYSDNNNTKTTLLSGKISLSSRGHQKVESTNSTPQILNPGQQSIVNQAGLIINSVNVDEVISWKKGIIEIPDQDIYTTMQILSRWYPIKVQFQGDFEGLSFGGNFSKTKNLEEVLSMFEATGDVKFEIMDFDSHMKERRVLVKKN